MLIHWIATNLLDIRNGGRLELVSSDIVFTELMICKDVGTNDQVSLYMMPDVQIL